jgi:hypothetical protein
MCATRPRPFFRSITPPPARCSHFAMIRKEISLSAPNSFIGTAAAYFTRGLLKYNFDCVRKIGRRVSLGKHMSWEISEVGDIQFCQLSQSTWS